MKKYIYLIGLTLIMFSCSESLEELNVDPDRSSTAASAQLLTAAQGSMSWVLEGQYNELGTLWGQYWTWGPGVSLGDEERYVQEAVDYNNEWGHMYTAVFTNSNIIIGRDDPHYSGIAKLVKAFGAQLLVDNFGKIPYSEANRGEIADGSILTPSYDNGEDVYSALLTLVDEAMADLNSVGTPTVGTEDLMFSGDIASWLKFAKSLKLKLLMRQSGSSDVSSEVNALIASGGFIESIGDMAQIAFDGISGDENPMYADFESGVGFFYVASNTSLDYFTEENDPRLSSLYNEAVNSGGYVGIAQGDVDSEPFTNSSADYSQATALAYSNDNPVIYISPWEVWFYRAEAAARFGTSDDDVSSFENAMSTHMSYLGADGSDFINKLGYNSSMSLSEKMSLIGIQKWVSYNGLQESEGWIESRRLDTPDNPMFTNLFADPPLSVLPAGQHPSIYFFPETEVARNPNTPAQNSTTGKVFWDN